jgi:hypothetical protein
MNYEQKLDAAQDPNTPQEALQLLATDKDPDVRSRVAGNPNTPQEALQLLATDKDPYVRYWVAKHPNRTELIERLVFMTDHKLSTANT